ncbi:TTYH3 isoform 4, partial [Pan troglodytes]
MGPLPCSPLRNTFMVSKRGFSPPQAPNFPTRPENLRTTAGVGDPARTQALLLLGAAALACLALDLLFLLFYSFWLCCRRRKSEEHLDADCCCTAWCVIIATLVCSAGIAVGFYGNG